MLTIAFAVQLAVATVQPGVADTLSDGRLCVALPGSPLTEGTPSTRANAGVVTLDLGPARL